MLVFAAVLDVRLFFWRVPPGGRAGGPLGRVVEDAGRDRVFILSGAVLFDGEEVEEHLQVEAVQDVRQFEFLAAALVVDDTDIGLSVFFTEVDPVDRTPDRERAAVREFQRVGGHFGLVPDGEFEVGGDEVGDLQLILQPLGHVVEREGQAAVQVLEAGRLVVESAQFGVRVDLEPVVNAPVELLSRQGDEGRLVGLFQQLFEDIVDDRPVVVRAERRPFAGLGVQAVAAEILERAVVIVVDAGGRQRHVFFEEVRGDRRVVDREHTGHQSPVQRGELFVIGAVPVEGGEGFPDAEDRDRVFRPDLFGIGLVSRGHGLGVVVGGKSSGIFFVIERDLLVALFLCEEEFHTVDKFRGQVGTAGGVETVPGEVQPLPGRCDGRVRDEPLFAGPEVFREGELQPFFSQKGALMEREEPRLSDDGGEHALFQPGHEDGVRGGEPDPVGGGDRDFVESLRDAAEVGHREDGVEQVGILFHRRAAFVAVDGGQPVDDGDDDVPDTVLFSGEVGEAGRVEGDGVFFQMFRDTGADEEVVNRLADFPETFLSAVVSQSDERADDPGAGLVQKGKGLFGFRFTPEPGVQSEGVPGERVLPAAALDVPGEDVVLQLRDLFRGNAGQTRLQVLKQVFRGEPLRQKRKDRAAEHSERLVFHRLAGVVEKRDLVTAERAEQFFPVFFLPADDDRDVPRPQAVFPQQFADGGGDPLTLFEEALALADRDVLRRPVVDPFGGVEEVLFEEGEFRGDVPRAVSEVRLLFRDGPYTDVPLFCHPLEPFFRLVDGVEDHGGVGAVGAQRDIDVFRLGKDTPQEGQLLSGEALEPVDGERVALKELCVVQDPAEFFDLQVFVGVALTEHGVIDVVDEEELAELAGQDRTVDGPGGLFEFREAGAGLAHFPEDGDEFFREPHIVAVVRVVFEFVRHGVHRPQHEDEAGAVVGDDAGIAAGRPEDEVGEAGEAQHFDVLGGRVAEGLQHGALGVIGILLRHDEDEFVLTLLRQSPEDPADIFRFAGTGSSGHKLKHRTPPANNLNIFYHNCTDPHIPFIGHEPFNY